MKKFKYEVTIFSIDKKEKKKKLFRTSDEICEFLDIGKRTYQSFMINRLKMNIPKTQFLKYIEIRRLTKEETLEANKDPKELETRKIVKSKLESLMEKVEGL